MESEASGGLRQSSFIGCSEGTGLPRILIRRCHRELQIPWLQLAGTELPLLLQREK